MQYSLVKRVAKRTFKFVLVYYYEITLIYLCSSFNYQNW